MYKCLNQKSNSEAGDWKTHFTFPTSRLSYAKGMYEYATILFAGYGIFKGA